MKPPIKKIWNGDYKCINLDCERDIPEHIVEKQFKAPKYRVCVRCRNFKDVRWKCVVCFGMEPICSESYNNYI